MGSRDDRAPRGAALTRTADKGSMTVRIERDTVTEVGLEIYEPPRFFESFLPGLPHTDPPDVTARICGMCPVAYHTSACNAIEDACGTPVDTRIARLRRLLYCGEWVASHALHIYLVHAPDYLGYDSVVSLARDHRDLVERGLALKRAGGSILEAVGARAVHPVNVRVGGFRSAPDPAVLRALAAGPLRHALDEAVATVEWVAGFDFPHFSHDHELLALVCDDRYPMENGVPRTSGGLRFPVSAFEEHIVEHDAASSSVRRAYLAGRGRYLTGPAARYALNAERLSPTAAEAAIAAKLPQTYRNPFRSIVIRAVEIVHALEEALAIIDGYEPPDPPHLPVPAVAGVGYGASEAPRGVLFQRYALAADGTVTSARITTPTSQNQACIEDDVHRFAQSHLDLDDERLARYCEGAIRNYDPCMSCATHVRRVAVMRS